MIFTIKNLINRYFKKRDLVSQNSKLRILYCCCLLLFPLTSFAQQPPNGYQVYNKIKFTETGQQDLTLDLFVPNNMDKPVPCIIVIQGGGFLSQDGQGFRQFAEYIAKNKYAAALISYRGRPDHHYQTTILDVKSAVSFVKINSAKYAIDPVKIGAMGRSAGGTLAALLAVAGDSVQVQAAVAYAGVFDFVARFTDSSQIAHQPKLATTLQTNSEWIGTPFSTEAPEWKQASASNHLDKNDSPILFMHCKDDKVVSWIQSQKMYEKMKNSGINSEIIYFEKGGHGFGSVEKELFLKPMISFFKKQFEQ